MDKQELQAGKVTLGSWVTIGNETVAEIIASAGFEWVVIDMEHSTMSVGDVGRLIRAVDARGSAPLVRVPGYHPDLVKRVLDAGAKGVIFPDIQSASQAQAVVRSMKYPPDGIRGVGLGRAQNFGRSFQEYFHEHSQQLFTIIQIESAAALDQIASIFEVDEVAAFIVGPYDLSCSLGVPGKFEHPIFIEALNKILEAGARAGVPAGIHIVDPNINELQLRINEGYTFIAYGVDIRMLAQLADAGVQAWRN